MRGGITHRAYELTGPIDIVSRGERKEEAGRETEAREALLGLH
jgi:hypothetical protein